MSGSSSGQDIFDVRKIRRLVQLMQEHDLTEIDLRQGDTRVQLRRDKEQAVVVSGPSHSVAAQPAPAVPAADSAGSAAPASGAASDEHITSIKSPMVGTFYPSPDPESPQYVKVGDPVGPETIVCLVEAMKVFNEIPAETSGKIVGILVENGESVEFGQPLFKVDTRQ